MQAIKSTRINEESLGNFSDDEKLWIYNGLDCCITLEIFGVIRPQITAAGLDKIYRFEMSLLPVAIDMMLRGFNVDLKFRDELKQELIQKRKYHVDIYNKMCGAAFDREFLLTSNDQLKLLFYDYLRIPEFRIQDKGEWRVTVNEEALEKFKNIPRASYLAELILLVREYDKKLQVVMALLDEDGRMRFSIGVAGTETGRWNSKKSVRKRGTNSQNITKELRKMLIPNKKMILCYSDLQQAESRSVAYLSGDQDYIEACESGDLHTTVAKMVYQSVPWTGNLAEDIALAEEKFYRHFSRRDLCKRAGHGTNYLLQENSLSKHLHISVAAATSFQLAYYGGEIYREKLEKIYKELKDPMIAKWLEETPNQIAKIRGAFPGIKVWHTSIYDALHTNDAILYNAFGFRRQFWSRPDDASTHREAVAFGPQSLIAYLTAIGARRIYHELRKDVQSIGMIHDAIVSQIREEALEELAPQIINCMVNPVEVNGRTMIVPSSLEFGHNWKDLQRWTKL